MYVSVPIYLKLSVRSFSKMDHQKHVLFPNAFPKRYSLLQQNEMQRSFICTYYIFSVKLTNIFLSYQVQTKPRSRQEKNNNKALLFQKVYYELNSKRGQKIL